MILFQIGVSDAYKKYVYSVWCIQNVAKDISYEFHKACAMNGVHFYIFTGQVTGQLDRLITFFSVDRSPAGP